MHDQGLLCQGRLFGDEALKQDGGALLLGVGVLDTQLALGVGAHAVNKLLGGDED